MLVCPCVVEPCVVESNPHVDCPLVVDSMQGLRCSNVPSPVLECCQVRDKQATHVVVNKGA